MANSTSGKAWLSPCGLLWLLIVGTGKNHSSSSDASVTGLVTLTGDCVRQLDGRSEGDLLCQICSSLQPSTTIIAQYCVNKLKNSGQLSFLVYANSNHTLQIDIRINCFIRGAI